MSGSFWKFGQDFSSQSSLSKLLNRAFIKIDDEHITAETKGKTDTSSTDESLESASFRSADEDEGDRELPNTEEEYEASL